MTALVGVLAAVASLFGWLLLRRRPPPVAPAPDQRETEQVAAADKRLAEDRKKGTLRYVNEKFGGGK